MKSEHLDFISNLFPFKNLKAKTLEVIFSEIDYSILEFSKGETIFSQSNFQKKVGFVISGECEVQKQRDGTDSISLNTLSRYESFGILSVFSKDEEYPTRIKATKSTTILFISGDDMIGIVKKYPTVSINVINFLATRISFLNKKIATFSEKSTAKKLASYLLNKFNETGKSISVSRTKLSAQIGVGRASLYRDLDMLEENKLIEIHQKKIIIICPEGLERI